jgi:hypothetical protein
MKSTNTAQLPPRQSKEMTTNMPHTILGCTNHLEATTLRNGFTFQTCNVNNGLVCKECIQKITNLVYSHGQDSTLQNIVEQASTDLDDVVQILSEYQVPYLPSFDDLVRLENRVNFIEFTVVNGVKKLKTYTNQQEDPISYPRGSLTDETIKTQISNCRQEIAKWNDFITNYHAGVRFIKLEENVRKLVKSVSSSNKSFSDVEIEMLKMLNMWDDVRMYLETQEEERQFQNPEGQHRKQVHELQDYPEQVQVSEGLVIEIDPGVEVHGDWLGQPITYNVHEEDFSGFKSQASSVRSQSPRVMPSTLTQEQSKPDVFSFDFPSVPTTVPEYSEQVPRQFTFDEDKTWEAVFARSQMS